MALARRKLPASAKPDRGGSSGTGAFVEPQQGADERQGSAMLDIVENPPSERRVNLQVDQAGERAHRGRWRGPDCGDCPGRSAERSGGIASQIRPGPLAPKGAPALSVPDARAAELSTLSRGYRASQSPA